MDGTMFATTTCIDDTLIGATVVATTMDTTRIDTTVVAATTNDTRIDTTVVAATTNDTRIDTTVVVATTDDIPTGTNVVVATSSSDTETKNRHVFPKISKDKLVKGKTITTHPFLEKSTEGELAFCKLLAVEKPFIAPFGTKIAAWKGFVALLNEQRDGNNNLLYDAPVTDRYAKDRLENYFSVVKQKIANTPLRSGCDDEKPPCELLQINEDLYEVNKSFETETNKKKNAAARNKKESEALRTGNLNAYLSKKPPDIGMPGIPDDEIVVIEPKTPAPFSKTGGTGGNGSSESSNSGNGKFQSSAKTKSSRCSSMEDSVNSFGAISKRHLDIAADKEQNKKLKLEFKLKMIEDKKLRREEKAKKKAFEREEERKTKEMEREQNRKLLEAVLSLHQKNSE